MIRIFKIIIMSIALVFYILKPSYAIEESEAVKYIENVGQQAINILKTPIENLDLSLIHI